MNITIAVNAGAVALRLRQLSTRMPTAAKKGVTDGIGVFFRGSRGRLSSMIYNVPIPRVLRFKRHRDSSGNFQSATPGGRNHFGFSHSQNARSVPAWRRTSDLLRNERADFSKLDQFEASIDNSTPYAADRHKLDRPSPIDGRTRRAPWRADTVREDLSEALRSFKAAISGLFNR